MPIENSPSEPTPDAGVQTPPSPHEQAEKQRHQFTRWEDYDVYRVTGSKPKEIRQQPSVKPSKKKPNKAKEQTSLNFAVAEAIPKNGDQT